MYNRQTILIIFNLWILNWWRLTKSCWDIEQFEHKNNWEKLISFRTCHKASLRYKDIAYRIGTHFFWLISEIILLNIYKNILCKIDELVIWTSANHYVDNVWRRNYWNVEKFHLLKETHEFTDRVQFFLNENTQNIKCVLGRKHFLTN